MLAIGLLVDDAIVVVENVERIMHEEGLSPRDATLKSMDEITGALIGIGLVLTAVFLPMAFFGGSTGVIYRQFSITIVSAMALVGPGGPGADAGAVRHPAQAGAGRAQARTGRLLRAGSTATSTPSAPGTRSAAWFLHRTWGTMIAYGV